MQLIYQKHGLVALSECPSEERDYAFETVITGPSAQAWLMNSHFITGTNINYAFVQTTGIGFANYTHCFNFFLLLFLLPDTEMCAVKFAKCRLICFYFLVFYMGEMQEISASSFPTSNLCLRGDLSLH